MKNYQSPRNTRREARTLVGRFRSGLLTPVLAVPVRGNEGGMISQSITMELDPVAGRLVTPVTGELIAVFVPVQAIDLITAPASVYAGMTDVIREKLLTGAPLFGLEAENEISKRLGINPRSISGVKTVNKAARWAHNAAVNYLRARKYVKATLLSHANMAVTPAIISQTVLERLNGVLDPEDRVNGAVQLSLPALNLPVVGIGQGQSVPTVANVNVEQTGGGVTVYPLAAATNGATAPTATYLQHDAVTGAPSVFAQLNATTAGNVSLQDFYNAEQMDRLVRQMRQIMDENPEMGEELVLRWAHGLSVDVGQVPFIVAERSAVFGRSLVPAMDSVGVAAETVRSDMALQLSFTAPIPRTELGGIIITFATVKPDETLASQPHPILSDNWGVDNFVADELALDPVPVMFRDLDSDCLAGEETTVAFYTGLNALKQAYVHYGFNRHLNKTTVANKTAVWQLEVPMSVTPDSVLYPAVLPQYPFADQNAEICTYSVVSNAVVQTPMIYGPTPVEEMAVIETKNLFEDL